MIYIDDMSLFFQGIGTFDVINIESALSGTKERRKKYFETMEEMK